MIQRMIDRARGFGSPREIAIAIVALALAGGVIWLLAERGGPEPAAEQASSSAPAPAPSGEATPSTGRERSDAGSDRAADPKRERGHRGRDHRTGADGPADPGRAEPSRPAVAEPPPDRKDVNEIVENLLGGKPDRSTSQAELPSEAGALLQGGDDPEPSKPPPALEEILGGSSGGG
jgi:hypothetical protein